MSTINKNKTIKAKKVSQTKANFVRITIDTRLEKEILEIQAEYPLLSTAEAVKIILSRGVKAKTKTFSQIFADLKITNPVKQDLSEDEMFLEWEKFNKDF